ncbi:uncharacterized protein LOC135688304 [Rhopilema esculentum]|uniref:uncharacterized protein LOC135688304 n=1 Tax=Rhopilema esculentum TaxID=499914 RepID=UPI0031E05767|eukprot:gene6715-12277_t
MLFYVSLLFLACVQAICVDKGEPRKIIQVNGRFIGVGMNNHLYMRSTTSRSKQWILVPNSCCVTQIHLLKNGNILGVGLNRHIYIKRNLFGRWSLVPNSCCVKDVTTFRAEKCNRMTIVGVGMNGKLYSKKSLNSRWEGPYPHSGTVKAVAGVTGRLYGVGMDNFIYRREGLASRWRKIPGSCCVKDIEVRDDVNKHFTYAVGMNNKLYSTVLANTRRVRWAFQGHHTCCVKSIQVKSRRVPVKIVGVGTNRELYFKPNDRAPWFSVLSSGKVTSITLLKNKQLVGIGMDHKMYTRSSVDSSSWRQVSRSCCVKSVVQLRSGRVIGVGRRNRLWQRAGVNGIWRLIGRSGSVTRITKTSRDAIVGIGMNKKLYIRRSYNSKWRGPLRNSGQVVDISMGSDGFLYGIGLNKRIYKKTSRNLESRWRLLRHHNCCVIGLAAI